MRIRSSALVIALALCATGCPSATVYRSAEPVAPGAWRVGGSLGVGAMSDREQDTRLPTGHVELSARRGIGDDLDVGAKLYLAGIEANATWRVSHGAWSWAVAPYLGGMHTPDSAVVVDAINLFGGVTGIASRRLSRRWLLSLGPLAGAGMYWPETGGRAYGAWLGGFMQGEVRVGSRWRISPELGLYRVVVGEVPVKGAVIQLGAGIARDL